MARMPMPQPWFRTPEDYEAIRHLVTDEPQLFDTFEEWLDAADKRFALEPDKTMGTTATPFRLESGRLDEGDDRFFSGIVYEFGIQDGINWRGPNGERILLPLISKKTAEKN